MGDANGFGVGDSAVGFIGSNCSTEFCNPQCIEFVGWGYLGGFKTSGHREFLFGGAFFKCNSSNDSNIPKTIYGIAGEISGTAVVVCLVSG